MGVPAVTRPRLLDLFCGAGGAAMGYYRAGFEVFGVDIHPQPHYPFAFALADAMEVGLEGYDAIHASPPCQLYTHKPTGWGRARVHQIDHPDLLAPTRARLVASGVPYVIENVPESPLAAGMQLCGTMFGLTIAKHRLFETNWPLPILAPFGCDHRNLYDPWKGAGRTADKLRAAQDTPWIPMAGGSGRRSGVTGDLYNAIPPAYTEWVGGLLLAQLRVRA